MFLKTKINTFRKKYDPCFNFIDAHIPLVFPISDSGIKKALINHIEDELKNWQQFDIHLKGIEKSWDHWMFLLLQEGNSEMIKLHDELYAGIPEPFLRKDIEFIPHLAVGLFVKKTEDYDLKNPKELELDKESYFTALKEANELNFDYRCVVDKLSLVETDDSFTKNTVLKDFYLSANKR